MLSAIRKTCRSLTHGAFVTLGAYGTHRAYGARGTLGINSTESRA